MRGKEEFIKDIIIRVNGLYKFYSDASKESGFIKNTKFVFEVVNSSNENGKAYTEIDKEGIIIDHIIIDDSLIYRIYDITEKIFKDFKATFLQTMRDLKRMPLDPKFNKLIEIRYKENEYFPSIVNDNCFDSIILFAYRFVLLHEIGHIFYGHCDFLREKEKGEHSKFLIFDGDEEDDIDKALHRRTLEYEADVFAGTQQIVFMSQIYNGQMKAIEENLNIKDAPYWCGFAIRIIFLLFQDKNPNPNYYNKNMLYLPETVRCMNIFSLIEEVNKIQEIENCELMIKKFVNGMCFAEESFNHIKSSTYSIIKEILQDSKRNEFLNEIINCWRNSILKSLKEYSRINRDVGV